MNELIFNSINARIKSIQENHIFELKAINIRDLIEIFYRKKTIKKIPLFKRFRSLASLIASLDNNKDNDWEDYGEEVEKKVKSKIIGELDSLENLFVDSV